MLAAGAGHVPGAAASAPLPGTVAVVAAKDGGRARVGVVARDGSHAGSHTDSHAGSHAGSRAGSHAGSHADSHADSHAGTLVGAPSARPCRQSVRAPVSATGLVVTLVGDENKAEKKPRT